MTFEGWSPILRETLEWPISGHHLTTALCNLDSRGYPKPGKPSETDETDTLWHQYVRACVRVCVCPVSCPAASLGLVWPGLGTGPGLLPAMCTPACIFPLGTPAALQRVAPGSPDGLGIPGPDDHAEKRDSEISMACLSAPSPAAGSKGKVTEKGWCPTTGISSTYP